MLQRFSQDKCKVYQGNAGLGYAIAYFTSQGIAVSIPLNDSQGYDLIADIDGKLQRVQVKSSRYQYKKSYVVELRHKGGRKHWKVGDGYDLLCAVTSNGELYLVPYEDIAGMTRVSISASGKYDKYKL